MRRRQGFPPRHRPVAHQTGRKARNGMRTAQNDIVVQQKLARQCRQRRERQASPGCRLIRHVGVLHRARWPNTELAALAALEGKSFKSPMTLYLTPRRAVSDGIAHMVTPPCRWLRQVAVRPVACRAAQARPCQVQHAGQARLPACPSAVQPIHLALGISVPQTTGSGAPMSPCGSA